MANPAEPLQAGRVLRCRSGGPSVRRRLNGEPMSRSSIPDLDTGESRRAGLPTTMLPPTTDDGSTRNTAVASVCQMCFRGSVLQILFTMVHHGG